MCRAQVYELCFSSQRRTSCFPRLLCWSRSATCSRCWTAATSEVRFSAEKATTWVLYRVWDVSHFGLCQLCVWCSQMFQNTPPSFSAYHRFTSDNRYLAFSIWWVFNPFCSDSSVSFLHRTKWKFSPRKSRSFLRSTTKWYRTCLGWKGWQPFLPLLA